ncbi:beta-hexosaminidase [Thalassotalea insulae]|uniref:Beta-hexosaminidase n=2 Tax=Thalassotalea insulae TaxID=2056778 RepID=A0ABQ6GPH0_9GAMM|nr:beta-N-acetylhexosaminidase [Thalassotalea insulae]GLX77257.1 beta-hexosaminidase [Thalassotalea insulae]
MMDVLDTSLSEEDKEILQHPLVGGLILFSRNFHSPTQIAQLVSSIRQAANKPLLIAVDHEGGRVQRFRQGFSQIPAMGELFPAAQNNIEKASQLAYQCGALMALEVQAVDIDISFAPVLDINGISEVIGLRSFHADPQLVISLAQAFINGMHSVGMKATGKHFPGHGSVKADSHIDLPIDNRDFSAITELDLLPFQAMIASGHVDALMPAHVIYPDVDDKSVGFSTIWLQEILRKQLNFNGVIFSDDLSMEAASSIGGYIERSEAAQQAGCDMLLLCNNRQACIEVLDSANLVIDNSSSERITQMLKGQTMSWLQMQQSELWQQLSSSLAQQLS